MDRDQTQDPTRQYKEYQKELLADKVVGEEGDEEVIVIDKDGISDDDDDDDDDDDQTGGDWLLYGSYAGAPIDLTCTS